MKQNWVRLITRAPSEASGSAIRESFLISVFIFLDALSREFGQRYVYWQFEDWEMLPIEIEAFRDLSEDSVRFQRRMELTVHSPLSDAERNDLERITVYAFRSVFHLARVTETASEATAIAEKFKSDSSDLVEAFRDGHEDMAFFIRLFRMMFQATCPAASSLDIFEEARKEMRIIAMEDMVEETSRVLREDCMAIIDEGEECSICLSAYKVAEEVCMTPCTHLFHKGCLKRSLVEANRCPLCRGTAYDMPGLWLVE